MDATFRTLLVRYFDDELSDNEVVALRDVLRGEPGALDAFVTMARREAMLVELVRSEHAANGAVEGGAAERPALRFRRWALPLAAAASILVALGVLVLPRLRADFTVARKTGQVEVTGRVVSAGPVSSCRLEYSDGTIVAVDQNSRVGAISDQGASGRTLEHQAGRIYLDLGKQDRPFEVKAGSLTADVLGTRLLVSRSAPESVAVLDGEAKVKGDLSTGAYVRGGQRATAQPYGGGRKCLAVRSEPPMGGELAWLAGLGFDSKTLFPAVRPAGVAAVGGVDLGNYTVLGGTWNVTPEGRDGVTLAREDPNGLALILFGEPEWTRGTMSFEFRVRQPCPEMGVGACFFGEGMRNESFTSSRALREFSDAGYRGWLRMRVDFEVQPDQNVLAHEFEVCRVDQPSARAVQRNWALDAPPMARGRLRGVGIEVSHCAIDVRNVKLENAAAGPVREDLLAFYAFNEGQGTVVRDLASTGAPMNLTIRNPGQVRWEDRRLQIDGPAMMVSESTDRLAEAWRETGGLTLEFWDKLTGSKDENLKYGFIDFVWKQGWFNYTQIYSRAAPLDRLTHNVVTLTRKGTGITLLAYADGVQTLDKDLGQQVGSFLANQPFALQIPGGSAKNMGQDIRPWTGELHRLIIHGRALTADEIGRRFNDGLPAPLIPRRRPLQTLGLYLFREGRGTAVGNRAAAGTLGSLVITRPELVEWTARGLKVEPGAEVKWVDSSGQLKRVWKKEKGLSFELWFRLPRLEFTGAKACTYAQIKAGPFSLGFASPVVPGMDPDQLRCGVYTMSSEQGKTVTRFYADGKPERQNVMADFGPLLELPVEICVGPAVGAADAARATGFEVCGAAALGRALTEEEVRERFAKGLPEVRP
jgi:ferric-dicitrate binding protein FerR (iron transport regulator)